MKTTLNIKNFRVFDENGVSFEINPITILTGSNSSGKSTVVKTVFLLNSFLVQIKKAIINGDPVELDKYKLDFTSYPNNLLGRFKKVVHDGSESKSITLEYTMHSHMLSKDVTVQLVFSANENDELNNAFLESIMMSINDEVFYFSGRGQKSYCNLNIIKKDCFSFLFIEYFARNYYGKEYYNYNSESKLPQKDDLGKDLKDFWQGIDKLRKRDIIRFVHIYNSQESLIDAMKVENGFGELKGRESIFFIPVVDRLAEMQKNEVMPFVISELIDHDAIELEVVSRKIISDFLESDFENFADYFADFEKRAFEQRFCTYGPLHIQNEKVHLLKAKDLSFNQEHLYLNYKFEADGSMDEETINKVWQDEIEHWENQTLSFDLLYEAVMLWNKKIAPDGNGIYVYDQPTDIDKIRFYHSSYKVLCRFAEMLVQEVVCPDWSGNLSYVSSARANVSRLYTLDKKDDFTLLLQKYFERRQLLLDYIKNGIGYYDYVINQDPENRYYEPNSFMNRWIKKFEIGKAISLDFDEEGIGVQIRLHKVEDDEGRLLADEGYGITQLVSILLQIETAILASQRENVEKHWTLDHFDNDEFHYVVHTIAIEEPEIHLHPRYQSLLADMFLEAYQKYNIQFIIETHSEYLIRKTQVFVARRNYKNEETMSKKNPFKVYYVPRGDEPYEMKFTTTGRFSTKFGKGFYDEASELAFKLF